MAAVSAGRAFRPSLVGPLNHPASSHSALQPTLLAPTRPSWRRRDLLSLACHAKKRNSFDQPLPKLTNPEKEADDVVVGDNDEDDMRGGGGEEEFDVEDEIVDDFEDDLLMDDADDFEDPFEEEEKNLFVGDGGAGGGISLAGTWWDKEALTLAEEVSESFDGDLKIYAFKTSANSTVRVRIEKLSTKYGSPSMDDIEAFSTAYRSRLDEAEHAGKVPDNLTLEVSSPGLERVVRIPEELERFKDRPLYVKYVVGTAATSSLQENDGVFRLISYDMEMGECTWGISDVKVNRQQAGKGRPLSKKQREWRLQTRFESLRLVRLHSDC